MDLFVRSDGTFGFEEYRRDIEDGRGWFAIGFHASAGFATAEEALGDALAKVEWLPSVVGRG